MRKTVRLFACSVAAAACFAGAQAATASADGLTVSCTFNTCNAAGQLGTLQGGTVLTPTGGEGFICVAGGPYGGPCGEASGALVFNPNIIFAGGHIGTAFGNLVITPTLVGGGLSFANGGPTVLLTASNGAVGTAVISPGFRKCVVIQGGTITTPPC
jgi:hypothetical protein